MKIVGNCWRLYFNCSSSTQGFSSYEQYSPSFWAGIVSLAMILIFLFLWKWGRQKFEGSMIDQRNEVIDYCLFWWFGWRKTGVFSLKAGSIVRLCLRNGECCFSQPLRQKLAARTLALGDRWRLHLSFNSFGGSDYLSLLFWCDIFVG